MSLPLFKTDDTPFSMLQNSWASQLNPLLANPANNSVILHNISLTSGSNTINTHLGRKLQGWKIIRQRSAATFYDTQDANSMPALTLVLVASANCVVDIEVF